MGPSEKSCKILDLMKNNDDESVDNDGDNNIIYFEKEDEKLLEFLIKYKNKSYVHCKWINYRHFVKKVDDAIKQKELNKNQDEDGDVDITKKSKKKTKNKIDGKLMNDL